MSTSTSTWRQVDVTGVKQMGIVTRNCGSCGVRRCGTGTTGTGVVTGPDALADAFAALVSRLRCANGYARRCGTDGDHLGHLDEAGQWIWWLIIWIIWTTWIWVWNPDRHGGIWHWQPHSQVDRIACAAATAAVLGHPRDVVPRHRGRERRCGTFLEARKQLLLEPTMQRHTWPAAIAHQPNQPNPPTPSNSTTRPTMDMCALLGLLCVYPPSSFARAC